MTGVRQDHR